jgi:hypothetical protein
MHHNIEGSYSPKLMIAYIFIIWLCVFISVRRLREIRNIGMEVLLL